MSNAEKEILTMFAKYAEMINLQLIDLHSRLRALEPSPAPPNPSPGPQRQLSAIQAAIAKLRD
jgi:hypothetical protein